MDVIKENDERPQTADFSEKCVELPLETLLRGGLHLRHLPLRDGLQCRRHLGIPVRSVLLHQMRNGAPSIRP